MERQNLIVVLGDSPYPQLFKRFGYVTKEVGLLFDVPDRVDMVVFSGGADVHPSLYNGVDRHNLCYTALSRDKLEQRVLEQCKNSGIKITGICRGLQFLNVMDGGFMFQHITDHAIEHMHEVYFPFSGEKVPVNSYHHQLVGLSKSSIPIAWAEPQRSGIYVWPKGQITRTIGQKEVEAAIFPKIRAMGVQYHPEMMDRRSYGRMHYEGMINDFLELSITEFTRKYGRKAENVQRTDRKVRRAGN
jgi:anthranilate/para-aminobenzoate synthase component II